MNGLAIEMARSDEKKLSSLASESFVSRLPDMALRKAGREIRARGI
jgi:hypothetical protein